MFFSEILSETLVYWFFYDTIIITRLFFGSVYTISTRNNAPIIIVMQ